MADSYESIGYNWVELIYYQEHKHINFQPSPDWGSLKFCSGFGLGARVRVKGEAEYVKEF